MLHIDDVRSEILGEANVASPFHLEYLLQRYGWEVPYLVLFIVGFAVAIRNAKQHRRAARLVIAGLLTLLVGRIALQTYSYYFIEISRSSGPWFIWEIHLFRSAWVLVDIIGIGLLIAAAFVGRSPSHQD